MQNFMRNYLVAILSLIVAVTALLYNSYRFDMSEQNRTKRWASFEVLDSLSHLQFITDRSHYDNKENANLYIEGWVHVNRIEDLVLILDSIPMTLASDSLKNSWQTHFETLSTSGKSNEAVHDEISSLREELRFHLKMLK